MNLDLILKRDRWVVIGGLALVMAIAWSTLLSGASMAPASWFRR